MKLGTEHGNVSHEQKVETHVFVSRYCEGSRLRKGPSPIPLRDRFWDYVVIADPASCWVWTGSVHPNGYGMTTWSRAESIPKERRTYTHRAVWILCIGDIPSGLYVCHMCDNPTCVNTAHLFLGTQKDNLADMTRKGRRANQFTKGLKRA